MSRSRSPARPPQPPQDRLLDRRAFVERLAALSTGAAAAPLVAGRAAASLMPPEPAHDFDQATTIRAQALADPTELTLVEAAALIRRRELSALELVDAYLDRINRLEGDYKAFNVVLAAEARSVARRASVASGGPLHGLPLAIKDNYYTAGIATTANSLVFEDFIPDYDATAVARLKAAGAIILGKTQMGPLATTRATTPEGVVTTVNAWAPGDSRVSPGGSSSGSATAVAGRLAASSTGTQTGGSITVPSNAQGLTGLKPTLGRVSLRGIIPLSYTRDHAGPLARDARDAALMLQHMAGPDPADPRTLGLPPVPDLTLAARPVHRAGRVTLRWPTRTGVPPDYADGDDADASARAALLATFERLGAQLVEVTLPADWSTLTGRDFNNVRLAERTEPFLEHLRADVRRFGVSLPAWINGVLLDADVYLKGQRAKLLLLRRVLDELMADCDVLLQTTHLPFDMIGLPLIAFPIGFDDSASATRPIGGLLGGLPFGEERLLSLVAAYQEVTDWHRRRPPDLSARSLNESGASAMRRVRVEQVMDLTQ